MSAITKPRDPSDAAVNDYEQLPDGKDAQSMVLLKMKQNISRTFSTLHLA